MLKVYPLHMPGTCKGAQQRCWRPRSSPITTWSSAVSFLPCPGGPRTCRLSVVGRRSSSNGEAEAIKGEGEPQNEDFAARLIQKKQLASSSDSINQSNGNVLSCTVHPIDHAMPHPGSLMKSIGTCRRCLRGRSFAALVSFACWVLVSSLESEHKL